MAWARSTSRMASRIGSRQGTDHLGATGVIPSPPPGLPDGDNDRSAVDDLIELPALADEKRALLDRGTVGRHSAEGSGLARWPSSATIR